MRREEAFDHLHVSRALDDDPTLSERFETHARDLGADLEARARNLATAAMPDLPEWIRGEPDRAVRVFRRILVHRLSGEREGGS